MDNRKATSLTVGGSWGWGARPLIHAGLHNPRRLKSDHAEVCAWCREVIQAGAPKICVLGYAKAHFHADCFADWAAQAAEEAKEAADGHV